MLGKGKRISPYLWGIFPMLVGKNPHRHGESGELIPPKLVYCPLFKQFGVVALVLFCQRGNFAIFSLIL